MKFDFLLLNIDGTIFDVVNPVHTAYENLAQRYGIEIHPAFLQRVMETHGSSRERLDREFFPLSKLHPQAAELSALYISKAVAEKRILTEHAAAFLRFLNDRQIPYGAVSSMPRSFVQQMTETYPSFNPAFSIVKAQVREGKPEPDLYLMAARKAGVHPNRILAIESTLLGAESAFLATAKVFYVNSVSKHIETENPYSLQDFEDLNELAAYLDEVWKSN